MLDRDMAISRGAPFAFATLAIAGAVGVALLLWPWIGLENVGLVFLTAIVGVAVRYGLWPSLFASVASSLAYNFFFTAPYYTLTIDEPKNVIAVLFFTVIAIIVSNVAARARVEANAAVARARATKLLYAFSRKLAGVGTLDDVLWATAYQTALMLDMRVVLLLAENGAISVRAGYPPEDRLDEPDLAAAQSAWQNNEPAGRGTATLPDAKRLFLPMRTGRGAIGVVGIDSEKAGPLLRPAERRLLDALIDQSALAIERVYLVEEMDRVKRTIETERLRSALLTSISHDLKTPLAAVLGASEALRDLSAKLSDDQKADLLATIIDESERLNRFIANLLDMTKLESGAVAPNAALQDLHEVVGSVLRRAGRILAQHRVELDLAGDLPMLELDAVLFEQVLLRNMHQPVPPPASAAGATATRCRCKSPTRARAFRATTLSTSSTSSTARRKAIMSAREPASASRSHVASSKPCTARSQRQTEATAWALCSRFTCRYRPNSSMWVKPLERRARQSPRR
jgi:two-component system, OmpR family, sensor histidine kinase KdpD